MARIAASVRSFAVLALICAGPMISWAADPQLNAIVPPGGQRGTEVKARFNGARLADADGIIFYHPGIEVKKIEPVEKNPNVVEITLAIAKDCELGIHPLRVRTKSGVSTLANFMVGALPDIAEKEPNNEKAQAQIVPLNSSINGSIPNEDTDVFAVEVKKGERISAEVEGIRTGASLYDPYLTIEDADGKILAESDDEALTWYDSFASIIAPKDGVYRIALRETTYANGSQYRLHIGAFPRPRVVMPAGGKFGQEVEVTYLGDPSGPQTRKIKLPQQPVRDFGLFLQDDKGISPSPNFFRLSSLDNVMEAEPNDELPKATVFDAPKALNGVIEKPKDVDNFRFKATKGQVWEIRVHARSIRSALDPTLTIRNSKGGGVASNDDDRGNPDCYLRFTAPADDEYIVQVTDLLGQGGLEYTYRVELTPVQPEAALGLPERRRYEDVVTAIPQGNRMAFMMTAARRDLAGELVFEPLNLPAGVRAEVMPMAADQNTVPVMLVADEKAPLSGTLVDIVAKPSDQKVKADGHLSQTSLMVRVRNADPAWTYTSDRMATAVTQKIPYRIEIVQPKAPLVRNGSMELKVRAIRDKDFKAPINVYMLYTPSDVGASGSATIPEGKDEATIPLTAGANAPLREWPIVAIGSATIGDGPVMVASPFAKLTIAEPFFEFAFKPESVERGKPLKVAIPVAINTDFEGKATAELLGLPTGVTSKPIELTKDSTEAVFELATLETSPVGMHRSVMCRVIATVNGDPVTHLLGRAQLRIDQSQADKEKAKLAKPVPAKTASATK